MENTDVRMMQVLLIDDHTMLRDALITRLDIEDDIEVIGSFDNATEAMTQVVTLQPDLIVSDINMPGLSCFDMVARVQTLLPKCRYALLSAHWTDHMISQALKSKIQGFLTKTEPLDQLITALRMVMQNEFYFSQQINERLVLNADGQPTPETSRSRLDDLSAREREILIYISKSMSRKEIANVMHISEKTVANHISNIMRKLNIHDRLALALFALREGLTSL